MSLDIMLSIIILILVFIAIYKVVTSIGFQHCRNVETPFGRAVGITQQLGITPFQNSVHGRIVCNGLSEQSAQLRLLPAMYCPTQLVGNLDEVKRLIDETCAGTIPSQTPAVVVAVNPAPSASIRRRNRG
jgi:hypothetical protein